MKLRVTMTLVIVGTALFANAQFDDILKGKIKIKLPTLAELTQGEAPLSTSIKDATFLGWPELDKLNPKDFTKLTNEDRNKNNLYQLKTGNYEVLLKSFCGRGYTHGPTEGMGYLDAPWKGGKVKFLKEIIKAYNAKPEVDRGDVQLLIWATLARVNPKDMKGGAQSALIQLLGDKGAKMMAEGALTNFAEDALKPLYNQADKAMRPFLEYDNKMRGLFTKANTTYAEFERLSVLPKPAEAPKSIIPVERWQIHPKGYLFRAYVDGYAHTTLQIVVPRKLTFVRDNLGRAIELNAPDYKMTISYLPNAAPFQCPSDENLKGHVVSSVTITTPAGTITSEKADWVFVGSPKSKKKAQEQFSFAPLPKPSPFQGGFDTWGERYERASDLRDRIETYEEYMDRMDRASRGEQPDSEVFDAGNIRDMIESLFGGTEDRLGVIADTHSRLAEHLAHATAVIDTLGDGTEVDPADGVFVPAHSGGQNILSSANAW